MDDHIPARSRTAGGLEALLRRWRLQRRLLNILLTSASPGRATARAAPAPQRRLRLLRQALLDYLAAGHFRVYVRLLEAGPAAARQAREPLSGLYRLIEITTDHILEFHDRYRAEPAGQLAGSCLPEDLERLRRVLRLRYQMEEQWVAWLMEDEREAVGGCAPQAPLRQRWKRSSQG